MKILLIGNGGRENAIAWKLRQSDQVQDLYISPGNAGTSIIANNVPLADQDAISTFIIEREIDIVIVGPEQPMVDGLIDHLKNKGVDKNCILFGPVKKSAMLEGSKEFAKAFMHRHNIPTAAYHVFNKLQEKDAINFIKTIDGHIVLKADGLAAGKGVVIHKDKEKAIADLREMFDGKFGEASNTVIIEEFLDGIEYSAFAVTNGKEYVLLPEAKDYKRIGDGDTGLNTGGMGSVSPVPFVDDEMRNKVEERIIKPTIQGLQTEDLPYMGFIFFGLIVVHGDPYLIEYNCRMGDPETQSVFTRMNYDFVDLILAAEKDELGQFKATTDPRSVVSIVAVSGGYPEKHNIGYPISGLDECSEIVFHSGTKIENGQTITNGGRVLAVTAYGNTLEIAQENAYNAVKKIQFEGITFRSDIAEDLIKKGKF